MKMVSTRVIAFRRDTRGATAMVFALSMLPIAASVGAAVDGARWYQARQKTSAAIDAAVIAGARHMQLSPSDDAGAVVAAIQNYKTNVTTRTDVSLDSVSFALVDNRTSITSSGDVTLKTSFLSIFGINELSVYAPARATFLSGLNAGTDLEVSLVLDFTASMCDSGESACSTGSKLTGLREAAKELVEIVVNENQSTYKSRVALVPFSERIRIARNDGDASLMTTLTDLPLTWSGYMKDCINSSESSPGGGETASTWVCHQWSAPLLKSDWKIMPCVTERIYTNRWDENDTLDYTDDAPGPGRWLMAHGGDRRLRYADSSDSNPVTSGTGASATDPANHWSYSSGGWCHNTPDSNVVMPLSSDRTSLKAAIDGFNAAGGTAGPLATLFGWFMLSPKWDSVWPVDSRAGTYADLSSLNSAGAPKLRKVAVLMTDGVFNMMRGNTLNNTGRLAEHAVEVCRGMKAAGIEVYTVGFALDQLSGSDRSNAEAMLQACGTSVNHFYSTLTVAQLKVAFRDIALKVTPIRLIQ